MKIVFFGTPQFAVPALERFCQDPDFEVAAVVTQPDKPRGRGKRLVPSPVKQVAEQHQIPVWQPRRIKRNKETLAKLQDTQADCFVVVAYGQILSPKILAMPRLGCVNGHGSLLPAYRGAAPIQWCLYEGVTETGMTTMLMDAGMDTGAMLLKSKVPVGLLEHSLDLAIKLAADCAELLPQTLQQLDRGELEPTPQDENQATYARLITKADYPLDWSKPAIALHNQIRAFYPNCVTTLRGQSLKVQGTIPLGADSLAQLPTEWRDRLANVPAFAAGQPGEVVGLVKKAGFAVQTGDGQLLVITAQPAGKRSQSGADVINGLRLTVGEQLG
ncbi:MAG: methionyl-tRNA formyltransferase [Spirulina sp. SIO3F2]|nr:methionyl-tRNA formyltransferase [Spirulina sp. SIO3F2]